MPPPPIIPPKRALKIPRVHVPGGPPRTTSGSTSTTVPIFPPPLNITTQVNLGYQAAHALFNVTQQRLREYARTGAKGEVVTVMATMMTRVSGRRRGIPVGVRSL